MQSRAAITACDIVPASHWQTATFSEQSHAGVLSAYMHPQDPSELSDRYKVARFCNSGAPACCSGALGKKRLLQPYTKCKGKPALLQTLPIQ